MTKIELKKNIYINTGIKLDNYDLDMLIKNIVLTNMRDIKDCVFHALGGDRCSIEMVYKSNTQDFNQYVINDYIH